MAFKMFGSQAKTPLNHFLQYTLFRLTGIGFISLESAALRIYTRIYLGSTSSIRILSRIVPLDAVTWVGAGLAMTLFGHVNAVLRYFNHEVFGTNKGLARKA